MGPHTRFGSLAICGLALLLSGCSHSTKQDTTTPDQKPTVSTFQVDPATAATISGSVHFSGRAPARKLIDMSEDPACVGARKDKAYDESLMVDRAGDLANAFIYVKSGLEGKNFTVPRTAVTIDQQGCWFHPHILGVQTGQQVDIINSDPVTHNIHPMAHENREWNHSQGPGDPPMHRKFLKPEIMIPVKCNIHAWMHAYIGVLDHPYFAVSKEDGTFSIANLPPGTYTIGIWHEKLGTQEKQITVAPHSSNNLKFDFKGN
jgi:plastocyanin